MAVAPTPAWTPPVAPTTGTAVINPVSGDVAGYVPDHKANDAIAAIERGREAQKAWAKLSYRQRAEPVIRFHDTILKRREELFEVMRAESGKAWRDCFAEMFAVASEARFYAYNGEKHIRPHRVKTAIPVRDRSIVAYHPVGVVGLIAPWNFPFILTMGDSIPALLAGNAVVVKPSSATPLTAIWGRDRMVECGIPADIFQIITGEAVELGNALVDHSDFIMFTGSTDVGRVIAQRAARRLIPYSMELGGKNALIVLPKGNLKHAATVTIEGAFNNNGQVCVSYERVYVHERIYDKYVAELTRQIKAVRLGTGPGYDVDLGSMVSEKHVLSVEAHVNDAVSKGARLIYGGKRRPDLGPAFFEPTILEGVNPEMRAFAEETFGPVIALYKFTDVEDAIRLANDSPYGLHFGVFSGNRIEGEKIALRLQAGSVCVNDSYTSWASMEGPMGGFKESGVGRRHGPEGIRKFTQSQTILTNQTDLQIGSGETALAINKALADALALLLRLWRYVPFLR